MKLAEADYNCDAFLCRGYTYEDNVDNVRVVKAGDVIDFHVDMIAGHRPGYAVSGLPTQPCLIDPGGFGPSDKLIDFQTEHLDH